MGKKYSENYIIDIYQYMGFCGLYCERKNGVRLSHKAAERKILLRKKEYPFKIATPIHESFEEINDEDILTGRVLLVKDDYEKVHPYRRPYIRIEGTELTEKEKENHRLIREKLIEEELKKEENTSLKPGEIKYQRRKEKRKVLSL